MLENHKQQIVKHDGFKQTLEEFKHNCKAEYFLSDKKSIYAVLHFNIHVHVKLLFNFSNQVTFVVLSKLY